MKKGIDISVIELEVNNKKLYYCQYNLLGEKQIVLTDNKKEAILYTKEELKDIIYDAESMVRKARRYTTLAIRTLNKEEKLEFDCCI